MGSTVDCRKCGVDAEYSHSDRRGDVHTCDECGTKTVYPMHTEDPPGHVTENTS